MTGKIQQPLRNYLPILFIGLSAALSMAGYESVRSASNTLFTANYGTQNLPFIMAIMPLGAFAVIFFYGKLLTWLGPKRTLFWTQLGSGFTLFALYYLISLGFKPAAGLLYIFRETYVVLIIEQYWSFINSSYSSSEVKRWSGFLIGVSSSGAVAGGLIMKDLVLQIGTLGAIFTAGLALIPAAFMSNFAFSNDNLNRQFTNQPPHSETDTIGFKELLRTPLLRLIVSSVFLSQMISAVLYLYFQTYLQELIPDADKQTSYSLNFYAILNAVSAVCQFLLVPLTLYFFRIFTLQLLVPLLNLGFCVVAILHPSMTTVGLAFMM